MIPLDVKLNQESAKMRDLYAPTHVAISEEPYREPAEIDPDTRADLDAWATPEQLQHSLDALVADNPNDLDAPEGQTS